nr:cytochrome c oxidase subunit III [Ceratosolen fusciceps]
MDKSNCYQPFHLVSPSPWPLLMSFGLMVFVLGFMNMLKKKEYFMLFFGLWLILLVMYQWWRDTLNESYTGSHTSEVQNGLKLGMIMFIISELFFFLSIFWCYFHMYLSPSMEIGSMWPPKGIIMFDPYLIPLLNTIILLSSGVSITWCHHAILNKYYKDSVSALTVTVVLGMIFTYFQYKEYDMALFSINDSVFGSIFYFGTGFHGLHVLIGTIFLLIHLSLMNYNMNFKRYPIGLEMAIWYWHFVDVVWLFLYLLIYFLAS